MNEDEIAQAIDTIAAEAENAAELLAEKCGLEVDKVLERVINELSARVENWR